MSGILSAAGRGAADAAGDASRASGTTLGVGARAAGTGDDDFQAGLNAATTSSHADNVAPAAGRGGQQDVGTGTQGAAADASTSRSTGSGDAVPLPAANTASATGASGITSAQPRTAADGAAPPDPAPVSPAVRQTSAAGGAGYTIPGRSVEERQINTYQAVADQYADRAHATLNGKPEHPTLAARHNDLTTALDQMRGTLDGSGNVKPDDASRTAYNEGRTEGRTSAAVLADTLIGTQRNDSASALARSTRNGIVAGSVLTGIGVAGTAATGGMIAWNNLRQGHHLNSSGGTTTNETNNGTNNVTNNSTTNGTANTNNTTNGTTNSTTTTNGNSTNTTNGTTNSTNTTSGNTTTAP